MIITQPALYPAGRETPLMYNSVDRFTTLKGATVAELLRVVTRLC
jgi:hypothetical protein